MYKKIISAIMAAAIAAGTICAVPVSAKIDLNNLPVPIASDKKTIKNFQNSKPTIKVKRNDNSDYWWWYSSGSNTIYWKPVTGALYYEIYSKASGADKFTLKDTVFGTEYSPVDTNVDVQYYVRAVTFTDTDYIKYSKPSNTVKVKKAATKYYDDDFVFDGAAAEEEPDYEEVADDAEYDVEEEAAADMAVLPIPPIVNNNTEEYSKAEESGYKTAALSPLSTFSADVDTASYANLRRVINEDEYIYSDMVRIEEMLNYFDYDYKQPEGDVPFTVNTELTDCPWNSKAKLLRVGIQGAEVQEEPASNLVFLVDVSGSMDYADKLPLVKKSINKLAATMGENDRISVVTYSGEEQVILAGAKGTQRRTVAKLTSLLDAYGCTNGESGINAAYALAEKYYIEGGNNRIILCTDGDLNVGISSEEELKKLIEEKRKSGVFFSVMGFGAGNIKDNKMETLADNGNGSYHYIDSEKEAYKVMVEERDSTLFTIAKDVKIQVEFNPNRVKGYRLIGYDNRRLDNEDFSDDTKDAGDIGAGHSVTALYEIIPETGKSGGLKYSSSAKSAKSDEWLTVSLRYKEPDGSKSKLVSKAVKGSEYTSKMSADTAFACAITEFGLILKESEYKGTASYDDIERLLEKADSKDSYKKEFALLVKKCKDN